MTKTASKLPSPSRILSALFTAILLSGCASAKKMMEPKILLDTREGVVPPPYMEPAATAPRPVYPPADLPAMPILPALPALQPVQVAPPAAPAVREIPLPPTPPVAKALIYEVKKGDALSKIAAAYGVTTNELAAHNKIAKEDMNKLRVGQQLEIPPGGRFIPESERPKPKAKPAPKPAAARAAPKPAAAVSEAVGAVSEAAAVVSEAKPAAARKPMPADGKYNVVSGDNLWIIARDFGLTTNQIRSLNNLKTDVLQIGQTLVLKDTGASPAASPETTEPMPGTAADLGGATPVDILAGAAVPTPAAPDNALNVMQHIISENETLETIAGYYNMTVEQIKGLNENIKSDADLKVGGQLTIVSQPK